VKAMTSKYNDNGAPAVQEVKTTSFERCYDVKTVISVGKIAKKTV